MLFIDLKQKAAAGKTFSIFINSKVRKSLFVGSSRGSSLLVRYIKSVSGVTRKNNNEKVDVNDTQKQFIVEQFS